MGRQRIRVDRHGSVFLTLGRRGVVCIVVDRLSFGCQRCAAFQLS